LEFVKEELIILVCRII